MRHEKIIRRDDGSRVKITVSLTVDYCSNNANWDFQVHRCEKGKRSWESNVDEFSYTLRSLSIKEQRARTRHLALQLATEEEVKAVMQELLNTIKPEVT